MHIENYSHVMHIVSTIKGVLEAPWDAFDVIRAVFPAGTLSGAPKIRAMEIIYNLEKRKRGIYGGMVFHLDFNGNMDSCITIRTMVASKGTVTFQSGAGIVADSIPENEYQETLYKSQALTDAVCLASQTITEERL
jgi:anthranilate synthase component 1